ncbi:MAG: DUF4376 domain-containing protein [Salinarimonadaceae bacterium]|nr:MAG: DUF4376 domain-containing protein [Salinarimonadaceae bacterium]
MPYVQRREGRVVGLYANEQPGYAEEFLAEDHPEVLAFLTPPETLDAYAARRRWEIETGGLVVGGAAIRTDRESQALINGALSLVQTDPTATIEFKGAAGWSTLDAAQMTAIALAVGRHVQKAFSAERTISEAIASQEITTVEEIDDTFAALMAP